MVARAALAGGPELELPGPELEPPERPLEPEPDEPLLPRPRRRWFELDELEAASSERFARRWTVLRITSVRTSSVGWPALLDAGWAGPLGCDSAAAAPTPPMAAIVPSAVSRFSCEVMRQGSGGAGQRTANRLQSLGKAVSVGAVPDPLRAAVIGYGLAGSVFHAPLIASVEGMEVAAIVTGNPERRAQAEREHPGATLYAAADELWADAARYDLAVVATANRVHADLSVAAIEAGLAVVVDKPMAANIRDAEHVAEAASHAGRMLTVFHNRRWDADFLTVRRLVDEGVLGDLTRLESRFDRFRPAPKEGAWREAPGPDGAGGVLWDLGPHLIDQACVLFGDPTHLYAESDARRPGAAVDDDAFVALRFAGGQVAHLWMSQTAPIAGPRVRISGLAGAYQHDAVDPQEDQLKAGLRPGDPEWGGEPPERYGRLVTGGEEPREVPVSSERGAWQTYYERVRDALRGNGPPPVDPADGVRAVKLVEVAHTAARRGQAVQLSA